jgi:hypothetical protein
MAGRGRRDADDRLAAELAAGKPVRDAAKAAEVSERTAYRRLENPGLRARVSESRDAMVAAAAGRLADGMAAAADVLRDLLGSQDEGIRLRAASQLLTHGLRVIELAELERRVSDLERRHDQPRGTP